MKKIFALILLAGLFSTVAIAQSKTEKELAGTIEKFRLALIDPDSVTLSSMVSGELTYAHSTGLVENKAAFIQALVSGKSDFKTLELSNQRIQLLDKMAVVWHDFAADVVDNGNAASVKLIVLTVWHRQKSGWKLVARQAARSK
ncbi:MAG: nuclear transport factor 2 family protein [Chitinophagaceae bacterium]|nr:nuclear transport factor 2 family protein [Chitinophagaceae bacterium]